MFIHIVLVVYFVFFITRSPLIFLFFFFNDTATTEIYTLSLHDALPISWSHNLAIMSRSKRDDEREFYLRRAAQIERSEEHTSELQSLAYLVCRLLLEKKKKKISSIVSECE